MSSRGKYQQKPFVFAFMFNGKFWDQHMQMQESKSPCPLEGPALKWTLTQCEDVEWRAQSHTQLPGHHLYFTNIYVYL